MSQVNNASDHLFVFCFEDVVSVCFKKRLATSFDMTIDEKVIAQFFITAADSEIGLALSPTEAGEQHAEENSDYGNHQFH